jgi:hypothetical protein
MIIENQHGVARPAARTRLHFFDTETVETQREMGFGTRAALNERALGKNRDSASERQRKASDTRASVEVAARPDLS